MTDPSKTLREIAGLAKDPAVRAKIEQVATEFELQNNTQNNRFQAALSLAELGIDDKLDDLKQTINERLGTVDARQEKILEMLEELQTSLRGLQARPPCMHPEKAREQLEAGGDG